MTIFVLLFVLWTAKGPAFLPGAFPDKTSCQIAEGEVATMIDKDKTITGWSILNECSEVPEAKKV